MRGEERETRANLAEGGARPGWGAEVRVSREERISAEPPRPRAASTPRRPHLRLALPPPCPNPGGAVPSLRARRLHIRYPGGSRAAGEGKVSGARRGRRGRDAAVAPRGPGSKSAPAQGGSKSGRRPWRSDWRNGGPSKFPPHPGRRRYLILDVLLPPLGSDVRGEVFSELHPDVSPSLPLGSSSYRRLQRRRRRQQRFRLLPTWAPARHGAELLSSSAAAEVSSEPPSRHLPPPLHSPAPPRPAHHTSSPW